MTYYAHTADKADGSPDSDRARWQPLCTGDPDHPGHLEAVARLAAEFASCFGASDWGRLAGLWHDLGKFSAEFQDYLCAAGGALAHLEEKLEIATKVDHSTAGSQHAVASIARIGSLLAYPIAGHHAGLPNGQDASESCLERRLRKDIPSFASAPSEILQPREVRSRPPGWAFTSGYAAAFFTRMVFSALVDADWLDTEQAMTPTRSAMRADRALPSIDGLVACLDAHLERFGQPRSPVQQARAGVLAACRAQAAHAPGLFSLTVPTGGGKTLSSLAFALEHARRHGMERIIYVLPFTSIIEQNAAVFREVFAPLGSDIVVEHHSSLDPDDSRVTPAARLAAENWDARIVVTTNVQFFESLHAARPSRCRKLHRLAKSVIVLDEAQTLPLTLLKPCLRALQEIATPRRYGTSVVLCTATQPAITHRPDFSAGLRDVREIIRDRVSLFNTLRRVRVNHLGPEPLPDAALASRLASHSQALCIVNTRRHAADLYQMIPDDGARRHLSALMCPAHRSAVLGDPRDPQPGSIRHALNHGLPCRVVTTQLIEAGVDVNFPAVYRALSGLDSIAQAAGRCNREGTLAGLGETFVFTPEQPTPRGFLRKTAESAAEILPLHAADPLAPEAIEAYFRLHYWRNDDQTDAKHILDCFPPITGEASLLGLRFKDCAEAFTFIESAYEAVLIPYGALGRELIEELRTTFDPVGQRHLLRRLQRYVVQIPTAVALAHRDRGLVQLHDRYLVLDDDLAYSDVLGLQLSGEKIYEPEKLTI